MKRRIEIAKRFVDLAKAGCKTADADKIAELELARWPFVAAYHVSSVRCDWISPYFGVIRYADGTTLTLHRYLSNYSVDSNVSPEGTRDFLIKWQGVAQFRNGCFWIESAEALDDLWEMYKMEHGVPEVPTTDDLLLGGTTTSAHYVSLPHGVDLARQWIRVLLDVVATRGAADTTDYLLDTLDRARVWGAVLAKGGDTGPLNTVNHKLLQWLRILEGGYEILLPDDVNGAIGRNEEFVLELPSSTESGIFRAGLRDQIRALENLRDVLQKQAQLRREMGHGHHARPFQAKCELIARVLDPHYDKCVEEAQQLVDNGEAADKEGIATWPEYANLIEVMLTQSENKGVYSGRSMPMVALRQQAHNLQRANRVQMARARFDAVNRR